MKFYETSTEPDGSLEYREDSDQQVPVADMSEDTDTEMNHIVNAKNCDGHDKFINKNGHEKKAKGRSRGYFPGTKIASVSITNGSPEMPNENNVHSEGAASISQSVNDLLHPKQTARKEKLHGQQETADLSQESDRGWMAISYDVTDNHPFQTGNGFYDGTYVDIRAQTKPTQMAADSDSEQSKEEYSDSNGWSSDDNQKNCQAAYGDLSAGDSKLKEKPIRAKKRKCHGRKYDKKHKMHPRPKTRNKNGKSVHWPQTQLEPSTDTGKQENKKTYLDKKANEKIYLDKKVEGDLGICLEMIGNRTWRKGTATKNEEDVRVWMKGCGFTVIIATDGSYKEGLSAFAGAVWIVKESLDKPYRKWSKPLMSCSCSFIAECDGFEMSLQWAAQHTHPDDSIVILTDCRTLVEELEKKNIHSMWEKWIRNLSNRLTVAYVPGHCGISYNETVDHLARETRKILENEKEDSKTDIFYE